MKAEKRLASALEQLDRALRMLAAEAEEQISHTSHLGVGVDELALEFDDVYRSITGLVGAGLAPAPLLESARPVNDHLQLMTDSRTPLWDEGQVRSAPEWLTLREVARQAQEAVQRLGEDGRSRR